MSKKFYCNYCNFRTIRKFRLEDHFKKEHTELTTIINKKNIVLVFFQKYCNENIIKTIESFYKNFENLKNIKKTICILKNNSLIDKLPKCIDEKIFYSSNNFCFNILKNKLLEFDYMLYFDDSYKLLKKINIFNELDIFFKNKNYKQVIFKKDESDNIILNYYDKKFSLPIFKNINYTDKYYIHDNIEIRNDKNIYKNNFISLDYHDYLKKNFINWPYFKLLPSIIKTDIFKEIKTELNTNIYLQKKFCYEFYDKKFISINLFESIIEENDNKLLNNDYKDMTIVTGFIYIKKDEGNKKHKYNYLEKSKKTLELKK